MPDVAAAPPFCDLAWHHAGDGVFTAERTALYDAAVSCAGNGMEAAGFDVRAPLATLDISGCVDLDRLAKRLAVWTGAALKALAFARHRDAAAAPLTGAAIAPVQEGLRRMIEDAEWALGSGLDLAERFAHEPALSRRQLDWAKDILSSARSAVDSVDARLSTEAGAEAMERAYREDVREALHAACRELTALDGDRCREANGMGWGAVSTGPGHRLASMATLTVRQAAHAWTLVHPHRRQLSAGLRERLFGA